MKNKIKVVLTLWLAIASTITYAQTTSTINGKITDSNLQPLDLVTVALFKDKDSSLVKTVFTEADGRFSFDKLANGSYLLRAILVGYANYQSNVIVVNENNATINLDAFKLQSTTKTLKEVNIAIAVLKMLLI